MQILEGIRIVSMAEQHAGPSCTMVLADMGADVLKVERPGVGDPTRWFTSFFASLNRNSRSMTLNVRSPEGLAICHQLIERADVFLEGYRPGVAARLGLGYQELRKRNPRLVYCSLSGFGQESPYRDKPAFDLTLIALAGALGNLIPSGNFTGLPDVAIGVFPSAMFAALGIVGALFARERSGVGQYLDVSMLDSVISCVTPSIVGFLNGQGRTLPDPSYGVYTGSDGKYFTISLTQDDQLWRNLCGVLGWSDISELRLDERMERSEEIKSRLRKAFLAQPRDHWLAAIDAAGIPSGPVLDLDELVTDPHVIQRGLVQRVPEPDGTLGWAVPQPIKFSDMPTTIRRTWPRLGEHTDEVLADIGKSKQDIERLHSEKVV